MSLLFLCNKELHKKFAPILIVCQRWHQSEKTRIGITFDLDLILSCGYFKSYFLKAFQLKKANYMLFLEYSNKQNPWKIPGNFFWSVLKNIPRAGNTSQPPSTIYFHWLSSKMKLNQFNWFYFRTQCAIMTLAGVGLLVMTFWEWENLSNLKVYELSVTTKLVLVSYYSPFVEVKY